MADSHPARTAYRRLPGRSGVVFVHRLYRGGDHLLLVETRIFTEHYRRLYFRDLESFSIHHTDRSLWIRFISGAVGFIAWGFAYLAWPADGFGSHMASVCFGLIAFAATVVFVRDFVLGQSCASYARTAVQTVALRPLNRLNRARRVRSLLIESTAAVQRAVPAPEAAKRPPGPPAGRTPVAAAVVDAPVPVPAPRWRRAVHALGLQALAVTLAALAMWYDYRETSLWGTALSWTLAVAALIAAIVQMTLSQRARLGRSALGAGLAVPGVIVVQGVALYVAAIVLTVRDAATSPTFQAATPFARILRTPPGESALVDGANITVIAAYGLVALVAWLVWARLVKSRTPGDQA